MAKKESVKKEKKEGSKTLALFARIFRVGEWSDWQRSESYGRYLLNAAKGLFVPQPTPKRVESFKTAVKKEGLSQQDLKRDQIALLRWSILMLAAAGLVLVYTFYQLFYGSFHAALLSLVVCLLACTLAFRYHFWYFQMKEHRLGCTIQEWFREGLLGRKK